MIQTRKSSNMLNTDIKGFSRAHTRMQDEGISICLEHYFTNYDKVTREKEAELRNRQVRKTALQNCLVTTSKDEFNGFKRMQKCRWPYSCTSEPPTICMQAGPPLRNSFKPVVCLQAGPGGPGPTGVAAIVSSEDVSRQLHQGLRKDLLEA